MLQYIVRRVLWVIVLLFVVSALTFVIFFVLPSADPAQLRTEIYYLLQTAYLGASP